MKQLLFDWDPDKRRSNIQKHRLDFIRAVEIFEGPIVEGLDDRFDYGEDRWIGYGLSRGTVLKVVYTREDDLIRIISAQKANPREHDAYFQSLHR